MALTTPETDDDVAALLADPRFELMPFDSFGDQLEHLPDGAQVAVTASPQLGIGATVEWSERAVERGYDPIPHLAARYITDGDHLDELAGRLADAGVTDVFVPGGDREEPRGEFASAHDLLVALENLGYRDAFEEVGITGYPEGHHFLDDETLAEAMKRKAPHATYIVTQLCYDPEAVVSWIDTVRDRGVDLPVEVGIPGVMSYKRLLNISQRVGVGDSVRFLRKTSGVIGFVRQLVGSRGTYAPDDLVEGLAPHRDRGIRGVHIYTFNEAADTEAWRRSKV
jgi:methylenetetrahydrofolate reductase (NADPH)